MSFYSSGTEQGVVVCTEQSASAEPTNKPSKRWNLVTPHIKEKITWNNGNQILSIVQETHQDVPLNDLAKYWKSETLCWTLPHKSG